MHPVCWLVEVGWLQNGRNTILVISTKVQCNSSSVVISSPFMELLNINATHLQPVRTINAKVVIYFNTTENPNSYWIPEAYPTHLHSTPICRHLQTAQAFLNFALDLKHVLHANYPFEWLALVHPLPATSIVFNYYFLWEMKKLSQQQNVV